MKTFTKTCAIMIALAASLVVVPAYAKHHKHPAHPAVYGHAVHYVVPAPQYGIVDLAACARPNIPNANMDTLCNRQNQADYR